MSPKYSLLTVGLTALGVVGASVLHTAAADPPAPSGPKTSLAPVAAPAPAPSRAVLLLSDGRTLEGQLRVEGADYVLRMKGGELRLARDRVEKTFGSFAEVYQYKKEQVPDDDPDEHLKLARWCLSQKLPAEAKVELAKVVAVSSRSGEAKAMLASIEAAEARKTTSQVDPAVVQTGGVVEQSAPARRTPGVAPLDSQMLSRAARQAGPMGLPVIFDLPPAIAVRRADEFTRRVHPVLQAACARCHNENHDGSFQLVEIKKRRDLTQAAIRANLEATLQLIDQDTPARSELLSRALVPHGSAARKPVFRSASDPMFQQVATWVTSLRPAAASPPDQRFAGAPRDPQVATTSGGGFASERSGPLSFTPTPSGPAIPPPGTSATDDPFRNGRIQVVAPPPTRFVPGQGMVVDQASPSDKQFPVSPLLSGQITNPAAKPATGTAIPAPGANPGGSQQPSTLPPLPPATGTPAATPGATPAALPTGLPPDDPAVKPSKSTKPVKLDPDLLQRALMNRMMNR